MLDLSQIYNGPYATYLMALEGAQVTKIEPPGGEPLRRRGVVGGAALPFAMLNGNKASVVLDLKSEEGRAAFFALAERSDVVVENFAPGVMERLGLGEASLRAINPDLIYASSSGFGRDGPYATYPAMDLTIQAMSGVMETTGFADRPPVKAGPAIADFSAGIHLYGAIVTALFHRQRTGVAHRVEVAMQDAVYASLSSSLGLHWADPENFRPRTGNRHGGMAEAPYNVYPAADGFVAIICVGEAQWRSLCHLMKREGLIADPRFATLSDRVANMDAVDAIVGEWTAQLTKAAIFEATMTARVPSAPVRNMDEVVDDPNMLARGTLVVLEHPRLGKIKVQQTPFRFADLETNALIPSRDLGQDTAEILAEAGLTGDQIAMIEEISRG